MFKKILIVLFSVFILIIVFIFSNNKNQNYIFQEPNQIQNNISNKTSNATQITTKTSVISGNLTSLLKNLSDLANKYDSNNSISLCLQFIRRNKYNSNNWNILAGKIDSNFTKFVEENNIDLYNYNFNNATIYDNITGQNIDFVHMCASLNSYIYTKGSSISHFSCWAGDLTSLLNQLIKFNVNKSEQELLEHAIELLGSTNLRSSLFNIEDMLADIDTTILYYNYKSQNCDLYTLLTNYYYLENDQYQNRNKTFYNILCKQNFTLYDIVENTFSGINTLFIKKILTDDEYISYTNNKELYNKILATSFENYFSK